MCSLCKSCHSRKNIETLAWHARSSVLETDTSLQFTAQRRETNDGRVVIELIQFKEDGAFIRYDTTDEALQRTRDLAKVEGDNYFLSRLEEFPGNIARKGWLLLRVVVGLYTYIIHL